MNPERIHNKYPDLLTTSPRFCRKMDDVAVRMLPAPCWKALRGILCIKSLWHSPNNQDITNLPLCKVPRRQTVISIEVIAANYSVPESTEIGAGPGVRVLYGMECQMDFV